MNYNVRRPGKNRQKFQIIKQTTKIDGSTENQTVRLPEIDAVNKNLKNQVIDFHTAEKNIRAIVERLKKDLHNDPVRIFNNENEEILEKYWVAEYEHRELVDPASARYKLNRAIRSLGSVSIITGTKAEIQLAIDKNTKPSRQYEAIEKIRSLLKFLGRTDVKLRRNRKKRLTPTMITTEELDKLVLRPELELLARVVFGTGMRIGEAFAVTELTIQKDFLRVYTQIDKKREERDPKWGSRRDTFITQDTRKLLHRWVKIKADFPYSRLYAVKVLGDAAGKALGRRITFNTLRHSYAIDLVSRGIPMGLVAQCLGNSEKVTQEYYAGYQITKQGIETVKAMLK